MKHFGTTIKILGLVVVAGSVVVSVFTVFPTRVEVAQAIEQNRCRMDRIDKRADERYRDLKSWIMRIHDKLDERN